MAEIKRRLPKGEETIPIADINGQFIIPSQELIRRLRELPEPSVELLIERVKRRAKQHISRIEEGIEEEPNTIMLGCPLPLSSASQIYHVEIGDDVGKELIEIERGWLKESLSILEEQYGSL